MYGSTVSLNLRILHTSQSMKAVVIGHQQNSSGEIVCPKTGTFLAFSGTIALLSNNLKSVAQVFIKVSRHDTHIIITFIITRDLLIWNLISLK